MLPTNRRKKLGHTGVTYSLLLCFLDCRHLLRHHRQNFDVDAVEFIKARPRSRAATELDCP